MVYMSPDAYRGVVSYSMDVFSFGVVLLELLTGLPVLDDDRDPPHLTMYVEETMEEEESSIEQFCDPRAGKWPDGLGEAFYYLTKQCLENKRNRRPTMKKVFTELSEMCNSQSREK
uniref:Protein kinase domain-containing protein n=1 Tax=Ciona savignyi TaxID=51511 RepID=H2YAX5_CIOSA